MDIGNFSGVSNQQELEGRFIEISKRLMSGFSIELRHRPGRPKLKISASELYFYKDGFWPDKSCHFKKFRATIQCQSLCWYVHHNADRLPQRTGIDITIGADDESIGASLLVRGVDGFDGPGCALNKMLFGPIPAGAKRNWEYEKTIDAAFGNQSAKCFLKKINMTSVGADDSILALVPAAEPVSESYFIGRRVGLGKAEKLHQDAFLRLTTFKSAKDALHDRALVDLDRWQAARRAE